MACCRLIAPLVKNDELYLRIFYFFGIGHFLNLKHPKRFTEKLQWLKLNEKDIRNTYLVDKVTAKEYVRKIIGDQHIIPTLAVYNSTEDIDFSLLPNQFVIKCTHDSGSILICKDKKKLDEEKSLKKLSRGLEQSYIPITREYPYENVPRRLIAEPYLIDESGYELKDYKFFCFDGEPKFLFVATDRSSGQTKFDYYDTEWNWLPIINGHPNNPKKTPKPQNLNEMLDIARKLSKGHRHIRVDLYNVNNKIYFGELTFFHFCGTEPFEPEEWDYKFGKLLKLPCDN